MNSLLDADNDEMLVSEDRELTLGTGTILGIFFGLVLLCGLVFGLGYKMGARKPVPVLQTTDGAAGPTANFGAFKPAAGLPVGSASAIAAPKPVEAAPSAVRPAGPVAAPVVRQDPSGEARPATASTAPSTPVAAAPVAGQQEFVVQIAAVSHQEDAELLVNALRAKGYPVNAVTSSQDKFFHIQVGPFTVRKDAEAAKQRLVGDGYQPIVK